MERFSCYLIGADSLLVECGQILLRKGHDLRGVITSEPRIADWAQQHGIAVMAADEQLAQQLTAIAKDKPFDYLFSITHLAILPEPVVAAARAGTINFHDGLLPRYAGLNTPVWALIERQTEYGVTWHRVADGIDRGDILLQRRFPVAEGETSISLNTRCFEAGIESFEELVDQLALRSVTPVRQDLSQRRYYSRFQRPPAACVLSWERGALELESLVRALDFGPYDNPLGAAKIVRGSRAIRVLRAAAIADAPKSAPGTVLAMDERQVRIATADGTLAIEEVAELDGKPLALTAWAERWALAVGGRLQGLSTEELDALTACNRQLAKAEQHWAERLKQLIPLELPYVQSHETADSEAAGWRRLRFELPSLWAASADHRFDTPLAALAAYLSRICQQSEFDLAFCDHTSARNIAERAGLASRSAPLRIAFRGEESFPAMVEQISTGLNDLRGSVTWLYDLIGREPDLRTRADLSGGRLLPVEVHLGAAESERCIPSPGTRLAFSLTKDAAHGELIYDAQAISNFDAQQIAQQLATVFSQLAANSSCRFEQLSLLPAEQRTTIVDVWNRTRVDYPRDSCIHTWFARQVERTPSATAVTCEGRSLTYQQLDRRANCVANELRHRGVGPEVRVGIHVERSLELVVGVLGVLKAGGAYVPLDPNFPADRLKFMAEDAGIHVLLTTSNLSLRVDGAQTVCLDQDLDTSPASEQPFDPGVTPEHLAYIIYTSGSTGQPKGVMVEQRNAICFFAGMDQCIDHDPPGTWLAVTTLSFDISVLELLWTLCRGFHVILYRDRDRPAGATQTTVSARPMEFSLFYWGNDDGAGAGKYQLLVDGARFADQHEFVAVWTPERHFHAFGGPYPNPAVTGAAVAAITERVQVRGGSCVLPLHHPLRVAEEWAVVDNLSKGRVAIAFASGWQPHDFVLRPEAYREHRTRLIADIQTVQRLWRGETLEFVGPDGDLVPRVTQPRPVQAELPVWLTSAGNPETYRLAGRHGFHVLTHLLGQSVEEVAEKIRVYRAARQEAGLDPAAGKVTLMLHTFVGDSDEAVRAIVRQPMKDYLASSVHLVKQFSWAFPAFKRPQGATPADDVDLTSLKPDELDAILEFAFERYFATSGLLGSIDTCLQIVERLKQIGVNEIACLIDFGIPTPQVLEHLTYLDRLRQLANPAQDDYSIASLIVRHNVTHLQCTPSMARMLLTDDTSRSALARLKHLYVGGEAMPVDIADQLHKLVAGTVTNMYGPTEATVWAATYRLTGNEARVPIGRPIANARLYIVDRFGAPLPVGVAGELWIGGDLVVRGYHERPELTAERFVSDPFDPTGRGRCYRTGDVARWRADGNVEFLGRNDHQVKIRGFRIELGEIEARLSRHPGVRQCVVVAREDVAGDQRLVAYLVAEGTEPTAAELRSSLRVDLPDYMLPAHFVRLEALPLTPNGKIDRRQLPAPGAVTQVLATPFVPPASDLQASIASLWCETLGLDKVGIDDNFFDVGGHSLLVVRVHRELGQRLDRTVSLTDLYRFPTIRSLARHLTDASPHDSLQQSDDRAQKRREALARRRQRAHDT